LYYGISLERNTTISQGSIIDLLQLGFGWNNTYPSSC